MAYGKSRNAKKTDLGLFILELLAKIKKNGKNWHFFADFFISKIVNISGLVIDRGNPNAPLERFIQARRFEPKFSSLSGHQAAQMPK